MYYLNMENYPVFFLLLSAWTFPTLSGTWGFYLNQLNLLSHVFPRPSKSCRVGGWWWPIRLNPTFVDLGLGLGTWPRACQLKIYLLIFHILRETTGASIKCSKTHQMELIRLEGINYFKKLDSS